MTPVGKGARFFVADEIDDWQELLFGEGVGKPILIGMDLASGSDLSEFEVMPIPDLKPSLPLHGCRPMTARQIRRVKRRRKR